ncbi:MAG: GrpB family protein [Oscillospiraceae bacterium]|nr:GrpB family protein [Oscillospiraceae bacterium]
MLKVKNNQVEFCPHDPLWEKEAEKAINILKNIFKEYAVDIQHIGSTAIKKIKSKPIIDIAVGITDIKTINLFKSQMRVNGFIYNAKSDNNRQLFFKTNNLNNRTHNIYIVNYNSNFWYEYIVFRDYMNINENKAREYETLKLTMNGKYKYALPTFIKAKADFIRKIIDDNFYVMMFGKPVEITVDKSISCNYPKIIGDVFPMVYGIADGLKTPSGKNQEAYIIGMGDAPEKLTVEIIAYMAQKNKIKAENNIKFIAAKNNMIFYKPEIQNALEFFDPSIKDTDINKEFELVCMYEKSCGAVVYTKDENSIKFLLIKSTSNRIGFPKGHIEKGETETDTAVREIYEETSLNVVLYTDFKEEYNYTINGYIRKKVIYFLAEFNVKDKYKILDKEITEQWLLPFEEAYRMLRFNQDKDILKRAYEKITGQK